MTIRRSLKRTRHVEDERQDVMMFAMDSLLPDKGNKLFIGEVFDAYKDWRLFSGLPRTVLNVNGFGRLFSCQYKRKQFSREGVMARGLIGARLR